MPHAYHRPFEIAADLAAAGFPRAPEIETMTARSRAAKIQAHVVVVDR